MDRATRTALAGLLVLPRLIAAVVLLVGVEAADLPAWDIGRFAEVADGGRPWVDQAVEYPPAMVALVFGLFAVTDSLLAAHRVLVVLSLVVDLGTAAWLDRTVGRVTAGWYLLLGLPLVPEGYLRFDLWAGAAAAVALVALVRRRPWVAAVLLGVGAAIKIWPVVLVASAHALARWRTMAATAVVGVVALGAWVVVGGLEAPSQVLSLRDATGWQVETPAGSLTALLDGDATLRRENDAYRIGTLRPAWVTAGRVAAVLVMAGVAELARRRRNEGGGPGDREIAALVATAAVAVLLVTSPLLSTQFLLWLTVPAAVAAAGPAGRRLGGTALAATTLTGVTLKVVGPTGVVEPTAAALLLARDVLLLALVPLAVAAILRADVQTERPAANGAR